MTEQPESGAQRGSSVFTRAHWASVGLGGLAGAALSLAVVFVATILGVLPGFGNSYIHDYLMAHPSLVFDMQNKAQMDQIAQEDRARQAAVDKIGMKRFINPAVAYVTGPANAKNTFVEFFDYNCGHCRNSFPTVQKFYNAHKKDTRFAFIDFPIFGADSTSAAQVAVAARRQGDLYLALHFMLMAETSPINSDLLYVDAKKAGLDIAKLSTDLTDPKIGRTVAAAQKLAQDSLVSGTPVFIVNGKVHEGEITEAEIKQFLNK